MSDVPLSGPTTCTTNWAGIVSFADLVVDGLEIETVDNQNQSWDEFIGMVGT